jgi:chaperonin GroES
MFKPILDRVLLRRIEEEDSSVIQTPDVFKQKSNKGEVIALGDFFQLGGNIFPMQDFLNVGDVVLFGEFNVETFMKDGEEFLLVRIQDIRGVECGVSEGSKDSSAPKKFKVVSAK